MILERYELINDALTKELKFKDNKLFYNNLKLNLLDNTLPNFTDNKFDKITSSISEFYDEIQFPNYDYFDDYATLFEKGNSNNFTRRIDSELDYGINVLELGCGTGQLSLFLARGNRTIYGVDISNGSLLLGDNFRKQNDINNAYFMKMDIFDLKFKENYFDFTVSNGVLHHTKDARKAFKSLVKVTKPGGLILVGLYHRYGRLLTKIKQKLASILKDNIFLLDKYASGLNTKKKKDAWVNDQFFNPHETLHLPQETLNWFKEDGVEFINLLPHCDDTNKTIFSKRDLPKLPKLDEFLMAFNKSQIQEGGFFIIIGKKL